MFCFNYYFYYGDFLGINGTINYFARNSARVIFSTMVVFISFFGIAFYGLLGIALIVLLTICCFKMQKKHIWSYIIILISVICDVIFEITILISQYTILIGPPKKGNMHYYISHSISYTVYIFIFTILLAYIIRFYKRKNRLVY